MRQQLHRINGFLADQAIHLSLTNDKLTALGLRMASKRYSYWPEHGRSRAGAKVLNFSQVSLRRIFAHLSHDTLLDATNSVNTTLAGMFVPMVSASPVGQAQLARA